MPLERSKSFTSKSESRTAERLGLLHSAPWWWRSVTLQAPRFAWAMPSKSLLHAVTTAGEVRPFPVEKQTMPPRENQTMPRKSRCSVTGLSLVFSGGPTRWQPGPPPEGYRRVTGGSPEGHRRVTGGSGEASAKYSATSFGAVGHSSSKAACDVCRSSQKTSTFPRWPAQLRSSFPPEKLHR